MEYFFEPYHALGYLKRHKRLWRYVAVPLTITILVAVLSLNFLFGWIVEVIASFAVSGSMLWYVFFALATLALIVVSFYFFIIFLNLISGPFNDLLSEEVEALERGKTHSAPFSVKALLKEYGRTITAEIARFVIFGIIILLTFVLTTAITGPLAGIVNGLVALFFIVFEFIDYILARQLLSFRQKMKFLFKFAKPLFFYGLGLMTFAIIPILNLLLIPVGVVSATRVVVQLANSLEAK